jgi:fatty acid desaturase
MSAAATTSQGDRVWTTRLRRYCEPRFARSLAEIAATFMPLALAWGLLVWAVESGNWWLYAVLLVPEIGRASCRERVS